MLGEGPGILRAPTKLVRAIRLRSCQAVWLVIHDEIILDVPEDQAQAACTALEAAMSTTFLGAPITAEAKIFGPRWGHLPEPKPEIEEAA
jgi:DNA polymerase I-like protein with 3'-5' exonuclease and polymerase domains